jgi:hypothetical protein
MTWRVEDISSDLLNQLRSKAKEFESFRSALDDSHDTSDTPQVQSDWKITQPIPDTYSICQKINCIEIGKQKTMLY